MRVRRFPALLAAAAALPRASALRDSFDADAALSASEALEVAGGDAADHVKDLFDPQPGQPEDGFSLLETRWKKAVMLCDYKSEAPLNIIGKVGAVLTLSEGDAVEIFPGIQHEGWVWARASRSDPEGWVPKSYCQELEEMQERARQQLTAVALSSDPKEIAAAIQVGRKAKLQDDGREMKAALAAQKTALAAQKKARAKNKMESRVQQAGQDWMVRELAEAARSKDASKVREALRRCKEEGLDADDLLGASQMPPDDRAWLRQAKRQLEQATALESLRAALQSGVVSSVKEALSQCKDVGVTEAGELKDAVQFLARQRLTNAVANPSVNALTRAIAAWEDSGLGADSQVGGARKMLARKMLDSVILHDDPTLLNEAIERCLEAGVEERELQGARAKLEELQRNLVSEGQRAALVALRDAHKVKDLLKARQAFDACNRVGLGGRLEDLPQVEWLLKEEAKVKARSDLSNLMREGRAKPPTPDELRVAIGAGRKNDIGEGTIEAAEKKLRELTADAR